MFTSRAEHRLLLREDNADLRLTEIGWRFGLVNETRWRAFSDKREAIEREQQRLQDTVLHPSRLTATDSERVFGEVPGRDYRLTELLRRPDVTYAGLMSLPGVAPAEPMPDVVAEQVEIQCKYAGYIERQSMEVARLQRNEETRLPENLDYSRINGLSNEVRQKLEARRPATLGHAARIPGVTPAAVSLLLIHLRKLAGSGSLKASA